MAPKKVDKPKEKKIIEDKTFGMKNKKGGKAQKHIAQLSAQASQHGKSKEEIAKERKREADKEAREFELRQKKEVAELFTQTPQRIPFGVDPKSVVCQYFKAGHCEKGKRCKLSHDLNVNRKTEKIDMYSDARQDKEQDTMDKWDQAKLSEVVVSKQGNPQTTTDIVCKFFIEAIQDGKYGWFWTCPNGDKDCKYRHALPPGFVLKQKGKKEDKDEEHAISLEEFIEVERHKLPAQLTPVTAETFAQWKKTRLDKKAAEEETLQKAKQAQASAGKAAGLSGKDLFEFNPEMYGDSDDEGDGDEDWDLEDYRKRTEDEREAAERARIVALGGRVDDLSLEDIQESTEDAVSATGPDEQPAKPGS